MQERLNATKAARQLALQCQSAVFSTLSHKLQGAPFGSVSTVMLTDEGDVIFYVSDIAQHARNLEHDNRLSITLYHQASAGDQNTEARLTLNGHAQKLSHQQAADYEARYFRLFPAAEAYKQAHDFYFWKMPVEHIRFIGGFGEIFWLTQQEWLQPAPAWQTHDELSMIVHMNDDHADACALIAAQHSGQAGAATMVTVYPDGCHFMQAERLCFVPFVTPCVNAQEVRKALVQLTQQARKAAA
ncbi:hypothetical protein GCM10010919_22760 [Alishewanella longhuensis]|uniref:DUF2470 domain-containing protein n=1 Tax=Alishewanella longhuensis TaxID=1091037 RepID=A0ABQ3L4M5_9ALTE|nr:DUF2470 domain-containing protein [Alishewanella longhuensis]GHG71464.1 hypothetical protein GCM10010919_22760 [Alishewanella longhuensis]